MKRGKFDRSKLRGMNRRMREVLDELMTEMERVTNSVGFTPIDTIDSALGTAFTVDTSEPDSYIQYLLAAHNSLIMQALQQSGSPTGSGFSYYRTLGSSQNNYVVFANTRTLYINATANITITGFFGGYLGFEFELVNVGTGKISLPHQSGSSSASNQIYTPGGDGDTVEVSPGEGVLLKYVDAASPGAVVSVWVITEHPSCLWQGRVNSQTGNYTFVENDRGKMTRYNPNAGYGTWTLPQTTPLSDCWGTVHYNDSSASSKGTVRINTETGAALFGYIFVGGGGVTFSAGSGSYFGWAVEQYRVVKTVSTTTYTVLVDDENKLLDFTNAAGCAVTMPQASATGNFPAGWRCHFRNSCAGDAASPYGAVTVTPTTSTVDGGTAVTVLPRCTIEIVSDSTNYKTERGRPSWGVKEHSSSPVTYDASAHMKAQVNRVAGSLTFNEPATVPTGIVVPVINASSTVGGVMAYTRPSGVKDTLRRGDGFLFLNIDNGDGGSVGYAVMGVARAGGRSISSNDSVTRDDNHRCLELTGTGATLTFFEIDATNQSWDPFFAVYIKNNGTGTWTLARSGADTFNGATSFRLDPCQGVHVYGIAATKWIVVTGASCFQTGTATPTHTAPEGTPYWETDIDALWVNNNGSTSWTRLSNYNEQTADLTITSGQITTTDDFDDNQFGAAPWSLLGVVNSGVNTAAYEVYGTGINTVGEVLIGSGTIAAGAARSFSPLIDWGSYVAPFMTFNVKFKSNTVGLSTNLDYAWTYFLQQG